MDFEGSDFKSKRPTWTICRAGAAPAGGAGVLSLHQVKAHAGVLIKRYSGPLPFAVTFTQADRRFSPYKSWGFPTATLRV